MSYEMLFFYIMQIIMYYGITSKKSSIKVVPLHPQDMVHGFPYANGILYYVATSIKFSIMAVI